MDFKDKEDLQLESLKKLLEKLGPTVDQAQDSQFEAQGWQQGFMEFIKVLGQVHFKAGYHKGLREGLEKYQQDIMHEIELQRQKYAVLREKEKEGLDPTVHPDQRTAITRKRIQTEQTSNSRKGKIKEKKSK